MNSEALAGAASAPKGRILPFGKYLLLQRVSVGGMAEVFKALPEGATRIDQIVAIKRILPNIAEDSEFIGMFVDEARLAGQLNHPNICRIYELGRVGDDHYIAMQFLWGRDLLKVMNRFKKAGQPIPAQVAAFIASKACAALHYAHTKRDATGKPLEIIHRDVSPQNIIVGYSGQVKLIDFGVARAASQSQKTQAGILKGKFGYMSPEMIRGLPIDHRSDVFAMGICLHEALTGARLFYGETDFATLELVRDAKVPPPSHSTPGIPPALDAIVLKALAREVADRFPSAQHLQEALESFLSSHYQGFGEAEVGSVMRQAFQFEVTREKQRLQVFSDMLEEGKLLRGAAWPSDAPPANDEQEPGERSLVGLPGEHVTKRSELSEAELARLSGEHGVHDEKTQIFFSAEELDEIRELDVAPGLDGFDAALGPEAVRQPAISDVILRGGAWSPSHVVTPSTPTPARTSSTSGTYQRTYQRTHQRTHQRTSPDARGVRTREGRIATMTIPVAADGEITGQDSLAPSKRSSWPMVILAASALLVAGYVGARLAQNNGATLEIAAVGDARALVRVDGVVRDNPPIRVQDLEPGVHEIEVDAKGYVTARRTLYVGPGQVMPVSLVLERELLAPRVGTISPVVESRPLTPTMEALPAPGRGAIEAPRNVRRKERTDLQRSLAQEAAPVAPAAEESGRDEEPKTATSDTINQQGELLISTLPWSHVFIDDVDTGRDTPVRALKVEPGAHRVGLRTPDGLMHTVDIYVEPGQIVRIIRRF